VSATGDGEPGDVARGRVSGSEIAGSGATGGPGSVAGFGPRLLAFLVDGAVSVLIAVIAGYRPGHAGYGLVVYVAFLVIELVFVTLAGQTPGMRVAGVVVVRARDGARPRIGWVAVRTLLLAAVVPALIPDKTGRPLHDRACGTATLRTR
jgi:uncharacterized RDD family membrane protein YckC